MNKPKKVSYQKAVVSFEFYVT